jgi:hypothetical protein
MRNAIQLLGVVLTLQGLSGASTTAPTGRLGEPVRVTA